MTLKTLPTTETHKTVRDQRTSERADWTSAFSGGIGVSVTVNASADCVVLGRQVAATTHKCQSRRTR